MTAFVTSSYGIYLIYKYIIIKTKNYFFDSIVHLMMLRDGLIGIFIYDTLIIIFITLNNTFGMFTE